MQGRRSRHRMTIRTSGSRRSRARARSPGSRQQNARTLAAFGGALSSPPTATSWRRSSTGPTRSPSSAGAGRGSTISGRTPQHPRGLWRRTTPESFRGRAARLGNPARPRRAGGGGGRGLDLERRRDAAGHPRPRHPAPVARRQRCRGAARVRSREQGLRGGRLRPAGGQGRRELARPRHAAAQQRLGRRRHDVGLCPHGAAVAARHRCRRERRSCSRCRARACRPARPSTARDAGQARLVLRLGRLLRRRCLDGGRRRRQPRKLDLPTDVQVDAHRGWIAVKPRKAWTVGGKTCPATPCSASGSTPSWPAAAISPCCSSPAERRSLQGFSWSAGPAGPVDPRQSAAGVRGPDARRRRLGEGSGSPACRRSAWSASGRSMSRASESNGDLLAIAQDPLTPPSLMLHRQGQGARPCSSGRRRPSRRTGWS